MSARTGFAVLAALAALTTLLYLSGPLGLVTMGGLLAAAVIFALPLTGLALTIVAQVITPLLGALDVSGLAVTLTRPLGALTLASWVAWAVRWRVPLTVAPQMIPLVPLLAVVGLSTLVMPDHEQSLIGAYRLLAALILYVLVANLAIDRARLVAVAAVVSILASLSSGIAIVQYTVPGLAVVPDDSGRSRLDFGEGAIVDADSLKAGPIKRVTGGTGEPIFLALMLTAVAPLNAFWWRRSSREPLRAAALAMAVLQVTALVLTFSRGGMVALAVVVVYLVARGVLPWLPTLMLAPAVLAAGGLLAPAGFIERMSSLEYLREGSTSIRADLWTSAWQMIQNGGLLGHGFGQFGPYLMRESPAEWVRDLAQTIPPDNPEIHNIMPHNLLAEITVEYGLLGLAPFVAFFVLVFTDLRKAERHAEPPERDLAVCLQAGLVAFHVGGLLVHGKLLKIFWILAGLSVALRRVVFTKPAPPPIRAQVREALVR